MIYTEICPNAGTEIKATNNRVPDGGAFSDVRFSEPMGGAGVLRLNNRAQADAVAAYASGAAKHLEPPGLDVYDIELDVDGGALPLTVYGLREDYAPEGPDSPEIPECYHVHRVRLDGVNITRRLSPETLETISRIVLDL